jgi:hypothetical protein
MLPAENKKYPSAGGRPSVINIIGFFVRFYHKK